MKVKDNALPIYLQIVADFEYKIAAGLLIPGERLDSIRDLAVLYTVNPNTMARALSTLEQNSLIYTDRTNGKYVVEDVKRLQRLKSQLIKQDTTEYINKAKTLKMSLNETKTIIEEIWEATHE